MILVGAVNAAELEVPFHLPQLADPSQPVLGQVFTFGMVTVHAPGAGEVNVAVDHIVEKGHGDYAAVLTPAQATVAGKVYVYAVVAGISQPYSGYEDIVDPADLGGGGGGSVNFADLFSHVVFAGAPVGQRTFGELFHLLCGEAYATARGLNGPVGSHDKLDGSAEHALEWTVQNGIRTFTKRDGGGAT